LLGCFTFPRPTAQAAGCTSTAGFAAGGQYRGGGAASAAPTSATEAIIANTALMVFTPSISSDARYGLFPYIQRGVAMLAQAHEKVK
jgi:hypothetical protein